jgi:hypothetical protein
MADMAAGVVRAPLGVLDQIEDVPGVRALEARVSGVGLLDMPGRSEPVSAQLVSLPQGRAPRVNDLVLRAGRMPAVARDNEVLVNEAFAEANNLEPGATLAALIYGRRREVTITGIASSPEFVFAVAPGAMLPEPQPPKSREILERVTIEHEISSIKALAALRTKEFAELDKRGVKVISMPLAAEKKFVDGARAASWARMKERMDKSGDARSYDTIVKLFAPAN